MKERFIKFLKKHRALKKYEKNVKNEGDTFDNNIKECIRQGASLIGGAFAWDRTPEGQDYWRKLSRLWKNEK